MSNLRSHSAPVQPFRPLVAPRTATYWKDECGAVHVLLSSRRKADSYEVIPLSTDLGGCAFRWFRPEPANTYDILLRGSESSCTCAGWAYTGGCKHIQTTFELLDLGVLTVAPGSNADDGDAA